MRAQVFCGNAAKSIGVWDLPLPGDAEPRWSSTATPAGLRALAAEGRWLFRRALPGSSLPAGPLMLPHSSMRVRDAWQGCALPEVPNQAHP